MLLLLSVRVCVCAHVCLLSVVDGSMACQSGCEAVSMCVHVCLCVASCSTAGPEYKGNCSS